MITRADEEISREGRGAEGVVRTINPGRYRVETTTEDRYE